MKRIQITPRLEFVRTLPMSVYFDVLTAQRRIRLKSSDGAVLLEIFLSLNTGASPFTQGSATEYRYPENVKIGLDFAEGGTTKNIDLTAKLLLKLRTALDSMDQHALGKAYKDGMEYAVAELAPIWHDSPTTISNARQQIAKRLTVDPISKQLTSFGTRSADTLGGALALSNYLFNFVPLPPLSLNDILASDSVDFQSVLDPCISVTHGTETVLGGQVDILVEPVYHNELIDEFDRLEHQIKTRLLEIHEKLASDGPIIQGIAQTNNNVTRLIRQLNDFDAALQDQALQIQSITRSNSATFTSLNSRMDKLEKVLKKLNIQDTP